MSNFVSRYASEGTFDGQKASVGRVVVVKRSALAAGIIDGFSGPDQDSIIIRTLDGERFDHLKFHPTRTQSDVEQMPDGSWTWPPRV